MDINFSQIIKGFLDFYELSRDLHTYSDIDNQLIPIRDIKTFADKFPKEYENFIDNTKDIEQICLDDCEVDIIPNFDPDDEDEEKVNLDFVKKLISFGGNTVEDISFDAMEELINQYGQLWFKNILSEEDFGGNENYFKTVTKNIEDNEEWIDCYGYALNREGVWRATNWFINKVNMNIFDTHKPKNVAYFGIPYNRSIDYLVTGIDKMT